MQTFATLCTALANVGHTIRAEARVFTVELEGRIVELARITAGTVEWVAISVPLSIEPTTQPGLGAIVRSRTGWALQLTLPIAEVSAATIAEVMLRLALEASMTRSARVAPSLAQMWAD